MTYLRDLIAIPETVHRGDFVLKLTDGVRDDAAAATVAQYVVTEQLAEAFDRALGLIGAALTSQSSKAAYLHGSFGAGKSHFMAVLYLLLRHDPHARSIGELAPALAKHAGWLDGQKFLLVPYHMIGARNLESALLGGYVEHIRRVHPEAPLPAVYLADSVLANAAGLRESMGDELFFKALSGSGAAASDDGWGDLGGGWDAARYAAAAGAPPGSPEQGRLVGDLVRRLLPAFAAVAEASGQQFVSIDAGLAAIARHARDLGYQGLVLFLDELILWLATHMANLDFVQQEAAKVSKLVEAATSDRPLPIVSFVARQRDLRELVGAGVPGAERLGFDDILKWWDGRFDRITLENRNLPTIVERRLLAPKSAAAGLEIDRAFDRLRGERQDVRDTLLGHDADLATFRRVYPFSPALLEALVAVSSVLQRERTAIRILAQLLADQRETLALGDVVPVGDLWDVLEEGDEPFSEEMKRAFEAARRLYERKLLPTLERQHGMSVGAARALVWSDPRASAFRADARIAKTLLLAALAPEVDALKALTAARLAALNHGSVRAPIAGQEASIVLAKCRKWVADGAGEIRISEDPRNPTIGVQLTGVDTETILAKALSEDNPGNRQRKVREILLQQLGIANLDELFIEHPLTWRGSSRKVDVVYANVRELPDSSLRAAGNWRLVLDYPFDPGHHPSDDLVRLDRFRETAAATQTLCWLPSFFSQQSQKDLGQLVLVEHVLNPQRFPDYAGHLNGIDREAARVTLDSQRAQLRERVRSALDAAYGIAKPEPGVLDETYRLDQNVQSLDPTFRPAPPIGATLGQALLALLDQALSHVYPAHPVFGRPVKTSELQKVLREVLEAVQHPEGRWLVEDRTLRPLLRELAEPLELGQMHEAHFVVSSTWRNHFERMSAADPGELSVLKLRAWTDHPRPRGLSTEVRDLVILVFAAQTNRSFRLHGGAASVGLNQLRDDMVLVDEELPSPEDWRRALDRAARLFGLAAEGESRSATNVSQLADTLRRVAGERLPAVAAAHEALAKRLLALAESAAPPRQATLAGAHGLLTALTKTTKAAMVVQVLASAVLTASDETVAHAMVRAGDNASALATAKWDLFAGAWQLDRPEDPRAEAARLNRAKVVSALAKDEIAVALGPALAAAERDAVALLVQPAPLVAASAAPVAASATAAPQPAAPTATGGTRWRKVTEGQVEHVDAAGLQQAVARIDGQLSARPQRRVTLRWSIEEPDPA